MCENERVIPLAISEDSFDGEVVSELRYYLESGFEFRDDLKEFIKNRYFENKSGMEDAFSGKEAIFKRTETAHRIRTIDAYRVFVEAYKTDEQAPDALFRMVVLAFEKETDRYERSLAKFQSRKAHRTGGGGVKTGRPVLNYQSVINYATRLEKQYPGFRYIDVVLFIKGYCYIEMGKVDRGIRDYERLTLRRPSGEYVTDAIFRIAQYYYEKKGYRKALRYYERLLPFKSQGFYERVVYCSGKIYYLRKRYTAALRMFTELLDVAKNVRESSGKHSSSVRVEAAALMADMFMKSGGMNVLKGYFAKVGPRPYEYEIYVELGDKYFEKRVYRKALRVYREILRRFPLNEDAPVVHDRIVEIYMALQNNKMAAHERMKMVTRYGYGSSFRKANRHNVRALLRADALSRAYLLEQAGYYQRMAVRSGKAEFYKKAINSYEMYLSVYRNATRTLIARINCNIGEMYLGMGDPPRAEKYFLRAIERSCRSTANGSALYGMLKLSERKVRGLESADRVKYLMKNEKYKFSGSKKLPPEYVQLVRIADDYQRLSLGQEKICKAQIVRGKTFYKFNNYQKSREFLMQFIKSCKGEGDRRRATRMILDGYFFEKNLLEIKRWSKKYAALGGDTGNLQLKAGAMRAESTFKTAALFEKSGDFIAAAKEYMHTARKHPKSKLADRSIMNAAKLYHQLDMPREKELAYLKLLKKYPDSEYADDALYSLARQSEQMFQFKKALHYYSELREKHKGSGYVPISLEKTANIYEATRDFRRANGFLIKFLKTQTNKSDRRFIIQRILDLQLRSGKKKVAIEFLEDVIASAQTDSSLRLDLQFKRALLLARKKRNKLHYRRLERLFEKSKNNHELNAEVRDYVARIRFRSVEKEQRKYAKLKIGSDLVKSEKELKRKQEALKAIIEKYHRIIDMGAPEFAVASYYKMSLANSQFVKTIRSVPSPRGIGSDYLELYKKNIRKLIEPARSRAIKSLESGILYARKHSVNSKWIVAIQQELSRKRSLRMGHLMIVEIPVSVSFKPELQRVGKIGND